MRRFVAMAVAVAVVAGASAARDARAQTAALPAEPQLALVDSDAAAYATFVPDAVVALAAWARRVPSWRPLVDAFAAASTRRLGFDATASWADSGLATDVPVVAALFAVDAEGTEAAFHARAEKPGDARALARAPRVWARSRLVARVVDAQKLRTAVAAFATSGPELVLTTGAPAGLAGVFRADAKAGRGIAAALARAKILAVARLAGPGGEDVLVLLRVQDRRWLVVDAFSAFGGVPVEWKLDGAALLRLAARRVAREHVGAGIDLHVAPGAALGGAAFGLALVPERILDAGKFLGWSRALEAARGVADAATARSVLDTGEREVAACEDFRPIATDGPLATFVLAATRAPGGDGLDVDASWALRAPGALDAAFATADDGLVDLAAATGVKLLALLPLAGTSGLAQLPRPGALAQDGRAMHERASLCGLAAPTEVLLFGWPVYVAHFLLEGTGAKDLLPALRNLAVAVKSYDPAAPERTQAIVLASTERPVLDADLDRSFKRGSASAGKRKLTVWRPREARAPWAVSTAAPDGKATLYAAAWGGDATLAWWWGQPSPAPRAGATPFVALVRAQLPWLVESVLAPELGLGPAGAEAAKLLGELRATLTLEPGVLHLHVSLEVK